MGFVALAAVMMAVVQLGLDIVYAVLDPRVRSS
jgi:ABC-type dipeptide/oligopeptide/nickel transport system permease component